MQRGDKVLVHSVIPGVPSQEIIYIGEQQMDLEGTVFMSLWNLTKNIEGHPIGSTVTTQTLEEEAGYILPMER
jgi:hypothetical protein